MNEAEQTLRTRKYNIALNFWKQAFEEAHLAALMTDKYAELPRARTLPRLFNDRLEEEEYEQCQGIMDAWVWYKEHKEEEVIQRELTNPTQHQLVPEEELMKTIVDDDDDNEGEDELLDLAYQGIMEWIHGNIDREQLLKDINEALDSYENDV